MTAAISEAGVHEIKLEVTIEATPERVWQALTSETDRWWLPDFRMVPEPRRLVFEAHAGGRVYEESDGGAALLWFTVLAIEPRVSLQLCGHIVPPWGGPAVSYLRIQLERQDDDTTRFTMTDTILGHVTSDCGTSIDEGWRQLFGDGLKKHVESAAG